MPSLEEAVVAKLHHISCAITGTQRLHNTGGISITYLVEWTQPLLNLRPQSGQLFTECYPVRPGVSRGHENQLLRGLRFVGPSRLALFGLTNAGTLLTEPAAGGPPLRRATSASSSEMRICSCSTNLSNSWPENKEGSSDMNHRFYAPRPNDSFYIIKNSDCQSKRKKTRTHKD